MCVPWELNPQMFSLLTQCSTTEPQEHCIYLFIILSILICFSILRFYLHSQPSVPFFPQQQQQKMSLPLKYTQKKPHMLLLVISLLFTSFNSSGKNAVFLNTAVITEYFCA